jgi:aspartyl protease family protein
MRSPDGKLGFLAALCLSGLAKMAAAATGVSVQAIMADRALVSVDGGPARLMQLGERQGALRLVEIRPSSVVVEQAGKRSEVGLGSRVTVRGGASGKPNGAAGRATLTADGKGHFAAAGSINGAPATLLVDTGASVVALPRSLAAQAGVRFDAAQRALIHTANGQTPAWRVLLNSVEVGGIRLHMVEAVVVEDKQLPVALLGMSFLNRTDMRREGDLLTLVQRY